MVKQGHSGFLSMVIAVGLRSSISDGRGLLQYQYRSSCTRISAPHARDTQHSTTTTTRMKEQKAQRMVRPHLCLLDHQSPSLVITKNNLPPPHPPKETSCSYHLPWRQSSNKQTEDPTSILVFLSICRNPLPSLIIRLMRMHPH